MLPTASRAVVGDVVAPSPATVVVDRVAERRSGGLPSTAIAVNGPPGPPAPSRRAGPPPTALSRTRPDAQPAGRPSRLTAGGVPSTPTGDGDRAPMPSPSLRPRRRGRRRRLRQPRELGRVSPMPPARSTSAAAQRSARAQGVLRRPGRPRPRSRRYRRPAWRRGRESRTADRAAATQAGARDRDRERAGVVESRAT